VSAPLLPSSHAYYRKRPKGLPHVESFDSTFNGKPILLVCHCELGQDHVYSDWVNEVQGAANAPAPEDQRLRG
jgi:hypothetical protein